MGGAARPGGLGAAAAGGASGGSALGPPSWGSQLCFSRGPAPDLCEFHAPREREEKRQGVAQCCTEPQRINIHYYFEKYVSLETP